MIIEQGTPQDIDELEALYNDLNDYFAETKNYPGWIKGEYPVRETAKQAVKEQTLFVLRMDDKIAGTVILNHKAEAAYHQVEWGSEDDYSRIIVIHTLAVHPDFFGKGLGRALMDFAKRYAERHNMQAIRLDTSVDNAPAIALYKKLGYRYVGTVDLGLNVPGLVWFNLYEMVL